MSGPSVEEFADRMPAEHFQRYRERVGRYGPFSVEGAAAVAGHQVNGDGYCTGCPDDVPWLACPVWAEQQRG